MHIRYTLEIPYNEIPCNKASLIRARHGSPQRADDRPLFPHYYGMKRARIWNSNQWVWWLLSQINEKIIGQLLENYLIV